MRAERKQAKKEQHYLGNIGVLFSRAQDLDVRFGRPAQITQFRYQRIILCQRHVCYYSERGDLSQNRFGLIMKNN